MSRRHRANFNVEGLESKVVLSGIAPTIAHYPQPRVTEMAHLRGSLKGTYVLSPIVDAAPTIRRRSRPDLANLAAGLV
jgi:hypothetical protein